MTDDIPAPPDGFLPSEGRGRFSTHNGPYFYRIVDDTTIQQAFFALPRHANSVGLVHGGMLSAFMDGVLAMTCGRGTGKALVTVHLSIDFLHMARTGDWIFGEGKLNRATRDIAFAEGRMWTRGVDVVRATGVFKLMDRPS